MDPAFVLPGEALVTIDQKDRLTHEAQPPSIQSIASQLEVLARDLADLARDDRKSVPTSDLAPAQSGPAEMAAEARLAYKLRRKRAEIIGHPELFGEPAWDILLDLYIAQARGEQVAVSSACIASGSPMTTALRWLSALQRVGLVERKSDPGDQRRVLVCLTRKGQKRMDAYLGVSARMAAW